MPKRCCAVGCTDSKEMKNVPFYNIPKGSWRKEDETIGYKLSREKTGNRGPMIKVRTLVFVGNISFQVRNLKELYQFSLSVVSV